ncbi:sigma-70 family RNA polymerase sigma factor [Flavivirga aquimarina]|uniref:Sigma-70 family RNA polymerase sigma factor n=1 Tax=Flavivirga aquimarina TaxID=2027862 RepID=A0ABT8WF47_9FLAO|nr:sigma-70 family RNA polymerase sigma factor [Flavivirga aquimarina]MDO5971779.1 sigma-70 family RNA polymerase sigma factor [Flavivirga aquimarina]
MDSTANTKLIDRLKKGEENAYMYLLEKYHKRLHAYSMSLIDNHASAQDIVQNVFLKTWKSRKYLDNKFSIESFLFKSVYNEFLNTYKKDRAIMLLQMKYYESLEEIVENTNDKSLEKMVELVTKEIEKLPPKCRQIFNLSKKEGLTNIEISEFLNISIKTVEAQITKAFCVLREKLGTKYETIMLIFFTRPSIS